LLSIKKKSYRNFLLHPKNNYPALFFFGLSGIIYLLNDYFLLINVFSIVLFSIGIFALLGLYFPEKWIQGMFIPFLVIINVLPIGYYLDMYIGFPIRLITTDIVKNFTNLLGFSTITSETILFIESRASKIDLSCSGIRSLWAGLLFYFLMSWINKVRINLKWLIALIIFILVIISFNIFRVSTIIIIDSIFKKPALADLLHEPLGIIGFILICGMFFIFFKFSFNKSEKVEKKGIRFNNIPAFFILIFIVILILFHQPKQLAEKIYEEIQFKLPSSFITEKTEFTEIEKNLFENHQGLFSNKINFRYNNINGTMIIVLSKSWRSHHNPKFCLEGSGIKINNQTTYCINKDFPINLCNANSEKITATFWFQNKNFVTENYSARIWSDFIKKNNRWAMITIVFNKSFKPDDFLFNEFHCIIKSAIFNQLFKG